VEDGADRLLGLLACADAGLGAMHALGELVKLSAGADDALLSAVGIATSLG
jgi:hypothetical protein